MAHPLAWRRLLPHAPHGFEKKENTGQEDNENDARDRNHSELSYQVGGRLAKNGYPENVL
jgi:hypothetical protein